MGKVLVLGSKGMLGYAVCGYFSRKGYEVTPLGREQFDIATTPVSGLDPFMEGVESVVNCAGLIKPTIAKHSIEAALIVNSIFPRNLATYCNKRKIACFHITTDCIYTGQKGQYTEEDYIDCSDVYGLTKAAGDAAECMVLRTSIVGEEKGQARSLLEWARSQAGKKVNGFTNHLWNGVTTVHLAEVIERIMKEGRYKQGVFHLYSPEPVTKLGLVSLFNEVYELGMTIVPTEAPQACDRTLASIHPLSKELCRKPLRQQIEEMKTFFSR